jgi:hypothetical protein
LLSRNILFKQAAFIIIFLAIVQFIIQMSLLMRGIEYVAASLVIDDTYYYLQTAWNTKVLGFVTFDGLHSTNGVQLLWFVITFVLATLVKSKIALLLITLSVSFLLNGLCYLVILKIGSILKQPILALFMASLWALQSLPFRIYSMGMENSLHALVFWCVIWQSLEFLIHIQQDEKPNFWSLSFVLILNAWTRLDSALLSAIFYLFCIGTLAYTYRNNLRVFWEKYVKLIAGTSFLAGFGFIAQLFAFQFMGDSFLPVSALIKTSGANGGLGIKSLDKLVEVFLLGMPSILQGRFPTLILILLGISAILLVALARVIIKGHSDEIMVFLNLWSCFLVGEIIYHIYIAFSGADYRPYFVWYRSPSFIFWITTGSYLVLLAFQRAQFMKDNSRFRQWASVGFTLTIFTIAIYMFVRGINFTSKLYVARYETALWIAENYPPDTIFAAWNAGQLSFFSNRAFINLDGLINNVDYYERVLRGSTPLTSYLFENRVNFIVDYDTYGSLPNFPVVRTFPIDDESGRSIQIWQITPTVSSTQ